MAFQIGFLHASIYIQLTCLTVSQSGSHSKLGTLEDDLLFSLYTNSRPRHERPLIGWHIISTHTCCGMVWWPDEDNTPEDTVLCMTSHTQYTVHNTHNTQYTIHSTQYSTLNNVIFGVFDNFKRHFKPL